MILTLEMITSHNRNLRLSIDDVQLAGWFPYPVNDPIDDPVNDHLWISMVDWPVMAMALVSTSGEARCPSGQRRHHWIGLCIPRLRLPQRCALAPRSQLRTHPLLGTFFGQLGHVGPIGSERKLRREIAIAGNRLEWTLVVECARNSKQCGCGYELDSPPSSEVRFQFGPKFALLDISDAHWSRGLVSSCEFVSS